ncbi:hypothetical protein ACLB2K_031967 [Fragaria x ananassa]
MSLTAVILASQSLNNADTRHSANFHPSIWGDRFLSYNNTMETNMKGEQQVLQQLKEEVKRMLMAPPVETGLGKLELIDDIQRLGVSYHFEYEIDQTMQQIHENLNGTCDDDYLQTCVLRFRLLRQHGYNVSCDMFNKFKDCDGNFDESLHHDIVGLQSLYEATHLMVRGEEFLEEALAFTTTRLESAANLLSTPAFETSNACLESATLEGLTESRSEALHVSSPGTAWIT